MLCIGFAIDDFRDPEWSGQLSRKTLVHLRETLVQLSTRMLEPHAFENDALIEAILNMVILAAGTTDREAALAHFAGLQKIIQLRGGISFLVSRPKLHFKLDQ